jgi:cytochrome c peroxidase
MGLLVFGCWGVAGAQEAAKAAPKDHMYVGAKKCKMCHNSEKGGAQFLKWTESKHSKAFATLATPKALEVAKAKGIADPQKSDECLKCHVTGHGKPADRFAASFVAADGVGCESCHGPGSDYQKMKTMQGIRDHSLKAEDYGLVLPTKALCVECHNDKSPTFKEFKWEADSTKIAHGIPAGYKRGAAAAAEKTE